jgi:peptidoglycan/xylan/chitin deacetylase (PgdA/CDA1 family)
MLHRFASSPNHTRGHSPSDLRSTLELLRQSGVRLLSLDDAVREYLDVNVTQSSGTPSVVFTVDDGYRDFMEVGLPVFEAFDCPVTCFVVPDVVDGKSWFWWDRLDFVLRRLPADQLSLDVAGERFEVRRSTHEYSWQRPLVNMLKGRSEEFRSAFMGELESRAEVQLPRVVPDEYRVMTWDAIRSCEQRGVQFGAHSLSHPVLSQVNSEVLKHEIQGSVRRLQAELTNPSSVFCYPYGLACDFGSREVEVLRAAGVTHAVSALPGVVRPVREQDSQDMEYAWRIPRFAFDGRPAMTLRQLLLS